MSISTQQRKKSRGRRQIKGVLKTKKLIKQFKKNPEKAKKSTSRDIEERVDEQDGSRERKQSKISAYTLKHFMEKKYDPTKEIQMSK